MPPAITPLFRIDCRCNFIEWRDKKIVYKRYASLFFVACIDKDDNELIALEMIHLFVEVLDRYFGNVCELDIIFNFHKVRKSKSTKLDTNLLTLHKFNFEDETKAQKMHSFFVVFAPYFT